MDVATMNKNVATSSDMLDSSMDYILSLNSSTWLPQVASPMEVKGNQEAMFSTARYTSGGDSISSVPAQSAELMHMTAKDAAPISKAFQNIPALAHAQGESG